VKETKLDLFIPVAPVPKAYKCSGSRMFLTRECSKYQKNIENFIYGETDLRNLDGWLWVEYLFFLERKESHKKMLFPNVKPDTDNLVKSTQDGIEAAGIIKNDSRIISTVAKKLFWDSHMDIAPEPGIRVRLGILKQEVESPSD
jgi:Holliday junction resolvase RusA-like endonuclease